MKTRIVTTVCGLILAGTLLAHAAGASKPDILFIMPDQWRGDCLSAVGHPVVRTPCLDALAKEGALFRRAYTTVPSCIPARFALLTGQFPQTSGVVGFRAKKITVPTLPALLREAGYATVLVGRNMHQLAGSDLGYQQEILGSTYVADDAYDKSLKAVASKTVGISPTGRRLGLTEQRGGTPVRSGGGPARGTRRQPRRLPPGVSDLLAHAARPASGRSARRILRWPTLAPRAAISSDHHQQDKTPRQQTNRTAQQRNDV